MQQGGDKLTLPYNGSLTSTQTALVANASSTNSNVETDIDNIEEHDNDSLPLIPPGSPPVTVTHFTTTKGKIERIKLTPESSSVSSPKLTTFMKKENMNNEVKLKEEEKEILLVEGPAEVVSVAAQAKKQINSSSGSGPNTTASSNNPFTNPFISHANDNSNSSADGASSASLATSSASASVAVTATTSTNVDNNNPFEQFDAITAALLTSTNPFHNPFLMPTTANESEVDGSQGAEVKQEVVEKNPGCTNQSLDRVSLLC